MGRLLKKKTTTKKRRNSDDPSSPAAENGADAAATPADVKKRPQSAPSKKAAPGKENFIGKSIRFLREVKAELKKVTWPSKKQTIGSTVMVIIVVMVISFFLGLVDMTLSGIISTVLQWGG